MTREINEFVVFNPNEGRIKQLKEEIAAKELELDQINMQLDEEPLNQELIFLNKRYRQVIGDRSAQLARIVTAEKERRSRFVDLELDPSSDEDSDEVKLIEEKSPNPFASIAPVLVLSSDEEQEQQEEQQATTVTTEAAAAEWQASEIQVTVAALEQRIANGDEESGARAEVPAMLRPAVIDSIWAESGQAFNAQSVGRVSTGVDSNEIDKSDRVAPGDTYDSHVALIFEYSSPLMNNIEVAYEQGDEFGISDTFNFARTRPRVGGEEEGVADWRDYQYRFLFSVGRYDHALSMQAVVPQTSVLHLVIDEMTRPRMPKNRTPDFKSEYLNELRDRLSQTLDSPSLILPELYNNLDSDLANRRVDARRIAIPFGTDEEMGASAETFKTTRYRRLESALGSFLLSKRVVVEANARNEFHAFGIDPHLQRSSSFFAEESLAANELSLVDERSQSGIGQLPTPLLSAEDDLRLRRLTALSEIEMALAEFDGDSYGMLRSQTSDLATAGPYYVTDRVREYKMSDPLASLTLDVDAQRALAFIVAVGRSLQVDANEDSISELVDNMIIVAIQPTLRDPIVRLLLDAVRNAVDANPIEDELQEAEDAAGDADRDMRKARTSLKTVAGNLSDLLRKERAAQRIRQREKREESLATLNQEIDELQQQRAEATSRFDVARQTAAETAQILAALKAPFKESVDSYIREQLPEFAGRVTQDTLLELRLQRHAVSPLDQTTVTVLPYTRELERLGNGVHGRTEAVREEVATESASSLPTVIGESETSAVLETLEIQTGMRAKRRKRLIRRDAAAAELDSESSAAEKKKEEEEAEEEEEESLATSTEPVDQSISQQMTAEEVPAGTFRFRGAGFDAPRRIVDRDRDAPETLPFSMARALQQHLDLVHSEAKRKEMTTTASSEEEEAEEAMIERELEEEGNGPENQLSKERRLFADEIRKEAAEEAAGEEIPDEDEVDDFDENLTEGAVVARHSPAIFERSTASGYFGVVIGVPMSETQRKVLDRIKKSRDWRSDPRAIFRAALYYKLVPELYSAQFPDEAVDWLVGALRLLRARVDSETVLFDANISSAFAKLNRQRRDQGITLASAGQEREALLAAAGANTAVLPPVLVVDLDGSVGQVFADAGANVDVEFPQTVRDTVALIYATHQLRPRVDLLTADDFERPSEHDEVLAAESYPSLTTYAGTREHVSSLLKVIGQVRAGSLSVDDYDPDDPLQAQALARALYPRMERGERNDVKFVFLPMPLVGKPSAQTLENAADLFLSLHDDNGVLDTSRVKALAVARVGDRRTLAGRVLLYRCAAPTYTAAAQNYSSEHFPPYGPQLELLQGAGKMPPSMPFAVYDSNHQVSAPETLRLLLSADWLGRGRVFVQGYPTEEVETKKKWAVFLCFLAPRTALDCLRQLAAVFSDNAEIRGVLNDGVTVIDDLLAQRNPDVQTINEFFVVYKTALVAVIDRLVGTASVRVVNKTFDTDDSLSHFLVNAAAALYESGELWQVNAATLRNPRALIPFPGLYCEDEHDLHGAVTVRNREALAQVWYTAAQQLFWFELGYLEVPFSTEFSVTLASPITDKSEQRYASFAHICTELERITPPAARFSELGNLIEREVGNVHLGRMLWYEEAFIHSQVETFTNRVLYEMELLVSWLKARQPIIGIDYAAVLPEMEIKRNMRISLDPQFTIPVAETVHVLEPGNDSLLKRARTLAAEPQQVDMSASGVDLPVANHKRLTDDNLQLAQELYREAYVNNPFPARVYSEGYTRLKEIESLLAYTRKALDKEHIERVAERVNQPDETTPKEWLDDIQTVHDFMVRERKRETELRQLRRDDRRQVEQQEAAAAAAATAENAVTDAALRREPRGSRKQMRVPRVGLPGEEEERENETEAESSEAESDEEEIGDPAKLINVLELLADRYEREIDRILLVEFIGNTSRDHQINFNKISIGVLPTVFVALLLPAAIERARIRLFNTKNRTAKYELATRLDVPQSLRVAELVRNYCFTGQVPLDSSEPSPFAAYSALVRDEERTRAKEKEARAKRSAERRARKEAGQEELGGEEEEAEMARAETDWPIYLLESPLFTSTPAPILADRARYTPQHYSIGSGVHHRQPFGSDLQLSALWLRVMRFYLQYQRLSSKKNPALISLRTLYLASQERPFNRELSRAIAQMPLAADRCRAYLTLIFASESASVIDLLPDLDRDTWSLQRRGNVTAFLPLIEEMRTIDIRLLTSLITGYDYSLLRRRKRSDPFNPARADDDDDVTGAEIEESDERETSRSGGEANDSYATQRIDPGYVYRRGVAAKEALVDAYYRIVIDDMFTVKAEDVKYMIDQALQRQLRPPLEPQIEIAFQIVRHKKGTVRVEEQDIFREFTATAKFSEPVNTTGVPIIRLRNLRAFFDKSKEHAVIRRADMQEIYQRLVRDARFDVRRATRTLNGQKIDVLTRPTIFEPVSVAGSSSPASLVRSYSQRGSRGFAATERALLAAVLRDRFFERPLPGIPRFTSIPGEFLTHREPTWHLIPRCALIGAMQVLASTVNAYGARQLILDSVLETISKKLDNAYHLWHNDRVDRQPPLRDLVPLTPLVEPELAELELPPPLEPITVTPVAAAAAAPAKSVASTLASAESAPLAGLEAIAANNNVDRDAWRSLVERNVGRLLLGDAASEDEADKFAKLALSIDPPRIKSQQLLVYEAQQLLLIREQTKSDEVVAWLNTFLSTLRTVTATLRRLFEETLDVGGNSELFNEQTMVSQRDAIIEVSNTGEAGQLFWLLARTEARRRSRWRELVSNEDGLTDEEAAQIQSLAKDGADNDRFAYFSTLFYRSAFESIVARASEFAEPKRIVSAFADEGVDAQSAAALAFLTRFQAKKEAGIAATPKRIVAFRTEYVEQYVPVYALLDSLLIDKHSKSERQPFLLTNQYHALFVLLYAVSRNSFAIRIRSAANKQKHTATALADALVAPAFEPDEARQLADNMLVGADNVLVLHEFVPNINAPKKRRARYTVVNVVTRANDQANFADMGITVADFIRRIASTPTKPNSVPMITYEK